MSKELFMAFRERMAINKSKKKLIHPTEYYINEHKFKPKTKPTIKTKTQ